MTHKIILLAYKDPPIKTHSFSPVSPPSTSQLLLTQSLQTWSRYDGVHSSLHAELSCSLQVLCVLYDGYKAAEEEPRLLGTTENKVCLYAYMLANSSLIFIPQLGLERWLKEQGHTFIVRLFPASLSSHVKYFHRSPVTRKAPTAFSRKNSST